MKKWQYTCSTNTIWTNFDYGEVEAESLHLATLHAKAEINENLRIANVALEPFGLSININTDQIDVQPM